jgi:catechol 2,3-dioxygenase-like lactoylglutathione lyase family enzyme
MHKQLRIARPTNNIDKILRFYRDGLGFDVLFSFTNHDGVDGVMLGHAELDYHLEFTYRYGQETVPAPLPEQLLVLYIPEIPEWNRAIAQMNACGFTNIPSVNPYWERKGKTFEDPDGYRVVLQQSLWP